VLASNTHLWCGLTPRAPDLWDSLRFLSFGFGFWLILMKERYLSLPTGR
jgi:hypothetical protein